MRLLDFETFSVTEKKEENPEKNTEKKGGKTFYKIIDKNKLPTWLKKNFIKDKKTMVTASQKEVGEINSSKTAVKLTNVPSEAVIDTEGKWAVLELYPVKSEVVVEEID
jgi:hypothetical protein